MQSRAPFLFIFLTICVDAIGIGLILPVMPALIVSLRGTGISEAAWWGGWLSFAYAFMQFLCGPLLGSLSDRFGRRPVLVGSLLALGVDYLVMALAPSLWLLFVARAIAGGAGATHATALAYLADVSEKGKRSANFGLVGAAFGIGFILGPALGGVLGELGPRAPFVAAAALALGNAAFGLMVLPESLAPARRRRFEVARANPFGALARLRRMDGLGGLMTVHFLYVVTNHVYAVIWSYFVIERFGWSVGMVGVSLAAFGVTSAVVQGWLIRWLLAALGEHRTAVFGLAMHVTALVLMSVIDRGWMVFAAMPVLALGVVVGPALKGIMADRVADDAQGELQGVLGSIQAVAVILCPLVMAAVFRAATAPGAAVYMPGAPFLLSAALAAVCLALFARAARMPRPA